MSPDRTANLPAETTTRPTGRLAMIGVGMMGEGLLSGLIDSGWRPADLMGTDRRPDRCVELAERYGVAMTDNLTAARGASTVVLVVKPQDIVPVLDEIAPVLGAGALVVSLAAGVPTELIESRLPDQVAVVRVMPNTPAQVREGMTAISGGQRATPAHLALVEQIMTAAGKVVTVPESYQDAVTAISGSGPAYLFYVVESMIEAGVHLGLPRDIATDLVIQTVYGSAALLRDSGEHPTVLRERVTSPGGTTAAAIRQLEDHRVRAAFMTAMEAARDRSRALADAVRGQYR